MSIEIEAKMRLTDRDAMVDALGRAGARFVAELAETNSYFDSQDGELKSTDQGLRIRVEVATPAPGTPPPRNLRNRSRRGQPARHDHHYP